MTGQHRGEPKRPNPCPWPRCRKHTRPAYLMCRTHWFLLPAAIRSRIWDTYRRGQTALTASPEYLEALRDALAFAAAAEAAAEAAELGDQADAAELGESAPVPLASRPIPCPVACEHPLTVHSADLGCWLCDCTYGRGPSAGAR